MSAQEQITKLQGLLERIQRTPRARAAARPKRRPSRSPRPPCHRRHPPLSSRRRRPPTPRPPPLRSTPSTTFWAPRPSLRRFLSKWTCPSTPSRPVAEISASQAPEADPIPLVSLSNNQPAPPPIDDVFGLDSEVSEVRVTTATRDPAPEVTVAAIEAEAEPIGTEELSEDDLVEVTEGTPLPPPQATSTSTSRTRPEQPPVSSQRSKVATSHGRSARGCCRRAARRRARGSAQDPAARVGSARSAACRKASRRRPPLTSTRCSVVSSTFRRALTLACMRLPARRRSSSAKPSTSKKRVDPALELAEQPAQRPASASGRGARSRAARTRRGRRLRRAPRAPAGGTRRAGSPSRRLEDDIPPPPESLATLPSVQPVRPQSCRSTKPRRPATRRPARGSATKPRRPTRPRLCAKPGIVARPIPVGSPESFSSVRESFRPSSFARAARRLARP